MMRTASSLSLAVGITLVAIKAFAWLMSDSLSMMSSLADSMLDVMASAVNFAAVRYALQPPDDEHRFGHGKAEDLATLAQSTFICGSGVFLIIEGIKRVFWPEPVYNSLIGIGVMIVSIVVTLALILYQRYVVNRTSSGAIAADAMHYFVDLVTNVGVIIAFILTTSLGWKTADPVIGLMIAVYIIYGAFMLGRGAFNNLMDREFSDAERSEIETIVKGFSDVTGLHDLRTRKSGLYGFIQFHLDFVDEDISLKKAHKISDDIEDALKKKFPRTEVIIHQDPLHDG
jgi:ferrous-iron efflux pump FieF